MQASCRHVSICCFSPHPPHFAVHGNDDAHLTSPWAPSWVKTSEVFISGFSKTKKKRVTNVQKISKSIKVRQSSTIVKVRPLNNQLQSAIDGIDPNFSQVAQCEANLGWCNRVASIRHVRRIPWNPLLEPRVGCIRVAPGREERKAKESESDSKKIFKRIFRWEKKHLWYYMHMVIPCCIFKLSHVPHKSLTSFNVSNAPRSPCPAPLHQWSRKVLHWHRPDNLLANRPYHPRAVFLGPVSREDGFFRTHRIHGPGVFTWYLLTFALNLW